MANTLKFGNGEWYGKKDTILAYNDLNSNYKPLPFNFSRASKATVINKDGLIEEVGSGQPRVDYKDDSKGALKLEPSRSNLVTYSEDFSQSVWSTWQSTKTLSNNINPKGTNGYYEISHTGSSSDNPNTRLTNVSLNGSYTLSFFIKINQSRYISLSIEDYNGDRARVYFDTINKTFTTITNVGSPITNTSYSEFSNGWIRISLSVNLLNAVYDEVGIGIYNPSGSFPSASGEVISVFGSQLEQGSYATSYIPTSGSAVTRLAESDVSLSNLPIFDYTVEDFSISFKITTKSFDSVFSRVLSKASTSSGYEVFIENNGAIYFRTVASGVGVFSYTNPNQIVLGVESNITITRSGAVGKIYKDGIEITSVYANHSNISSSLSNNLRLGSYVQSGYNFSGQIKDVKLYNTALTDQELQALTQV